MPARQAKIELTEASNARLKTFLQCIVRYEEKLEVLRQFLVSNEIFDCYAAFCRIDRNQDGFVTPLELLNFFRDNGVTSVNESDCYFVIKFFDSDVDGKLHFADFMQILLPTLNEKMRSECTQRVASGCKPNEFLTMDVEQDMVRLFNMEIEMHRESEMCKQLLSCMADYTPDGIFDSLDSSKVGFLDQKSFFNFFKRMGKPAQEEDINALMRRIEYDQD